MEFDTPIILQRAADKTGFNRVRYTERDIPTSIQQISIMTLFGDIKHTVLASSLLIKRFREELKNSKYFILCSWPGFEGLFPFVNEYWSIPNDNNFKTFYNDAVGFRNGSNLEIGYTRGLNYFFADNSNYDVLTRFYEKDIKKEFFDKFKDIKRYFPSIPSATSLGIDFAKLLNNFRKAKVFIYPAMTIQEWNQGKLEKIQVNKDFWIELVRFLVNNGFSVVVYGGLGAHNLSTELADLASDCLHFNHQNILQVAAVMRSCDFVVDFFSGISKLGFLARTSVLTFDERLKYNECKDYELDEILGACPVDARMTYRTTFSFARLLKADKDTWKSNFFDVLLAKIKKMDLVIDRNLLPNTSESYDVIPYDNLKKLNINRLGTRFLAKVE